MGGVVLTDADVANFQFAKVLVRDEDLASSVEMLREHALARKALAVHLCNAYTLTLAAQDAQYAELLSHRSANLADGAPVAWFGRLQTGRPQRGPVRGPSLMREALRCEGFDHFLLGGSDDVIADLRAAAVSAKPDVRIVGTLAPEFRPVTDDDIVTFAQAITESGANIVWVGLGTPKQDELMAALVDRVDTVLVGVGAAFDFLSDRKKEAPTFLHGTGLEWLHRLASEPRRLWRRYMLGNLQFLRYAVREMRKTRQTRL